MENNYRMRIFKFDDDWICEFPDLPGCTGIGNSPQEAVADGEIAKSLWLEDYYSDNKSYPESSDAYSKTYNGKILLRCGKSLHRRLALTAEDEGLSLNQLCSQYLSIGLTTKSVSPTIDLKYSTSNLLVSTNSELHWDKHAVHAETVVHFPVA